MFKTIASKTAYEHDNADNAYDDGENTDNRKFKTPLIADSF